MDQDQRFDIEDLMPEDMVIWEDVEDLSDRQEYTWPYWRQVLDHPYLGHGFCTSCGGGGTCTLLLFKDALVSSVLRELDQLGLLKTLDNEGGTGDE